MSEKTNPFPSIVSRELEAGYQRGNPVINDCNLTLAGPGIFHLQGENGKGKSTFIELCSGYLTPWKGEVQICGVSAQKTSARDYRSVVRSKQALHPSMSVKDHLYFVAKVSNCDFNELMYRADTYGLTKWMDQSAKSLSTGTAKKLWILVCTPTVKPVMLFDEPFDSLDSETTTILESEISSWASTSLVLFTSHKIVDQKKFDCMYGVKNVTF